MADLILYTRDGCHLCDETRGIVAGLLAERQVAGLFAPALVERDIATDPAWERANFAAIPVIELGAQRLEVATSRAKIRALLASFDHASARR